MGYRTLSACLHDLESRGQLLRIEQELGAQAKYAGKAALKALA